LTPLDTLIAPRSIAIIGASEDASRAGGRPIAALLRLGYRGRILPINPNRSTVQGLPCFPDVDAINGDIDVALIALPAVAACDAAEACARRGVRAAVVFSAGFAELDEQGAALQARLTRTARVSGMRVLGPNCIGMFNANESAWLTFTTVLDDLQSGVGRVAMVSQSGGYGSAVLKLGLQEGLRFGVWVTTGNECDVEVGELLQALAPRPDVSAIVLYVEGVRSGPTFIGGLDMARRHGKPVIAMKVGRTAAGASAVASHTASLAGEDWVYDEVLRAYGAVRVRTTEELIDVARAFESQRLPLGNRLGVVTTSGGIGAQIADFASEAGLVLPPPPAQTQAGIRQLAPQAATGNPVDVTGLVLTSPEVMAKVLGEVLKSGSYDLVYVFLGLIAGNRKMADTLLTTLSAVRAQFADQIIAISIIGDDEVARRYEEAGFLVARDPSRAVRSIAALVRMGQGTHAAMRSRPADDAAAAPELPAGRSFNEVDAKALFARAGIHVPQEEFIRSASDELRLPGPGPYALKVVSSALAHKSDVGGVALNLRDLAAVRDALYRMDLTVRQQAPQAPIEGFLVSPMAGPGVECFLGIHPDPVFGPLVVFGLGGIAVEVFRDVVCRLAPVDREEAVAMVRGIRSFTLLQGHRGRPKADLEALADAIVAMSRLAAANAGRIAAAEINPLLVLPEGRGALALDAVLVTRPGAADARKELA